MLKYITNDMISMFRYLPCGIAAGIIGFMILHMINQKRVQQEKRPYHLWPITCFWAYMVIILCITFFSRESGSRDGIDLELFSTWGINERNNAYVIENVLLFIPYGFLVAWTFPKCNRLLPVFFVGFFSSFSIECMQLITKRGYFQIDDILTNILGSIIGFFLFRWCKFLWSHFLVYQGKKK